MNKQDFPIIRTESNGKRSIYDVLRERFVALTPEEGVRQQFIHYLINEKHYPQNLLANEVSISLNGTSKRCDSVLYDIHLKPKAIIEYKAPEVQITQKVFDQIIRYNIIMQVEYLIISNGKQTYICRIKDKTSIEFIKEIPDYYNL